MQNAPKLSFHRSSGRYFVRLDGKAVYLGRDKKAAGDAYSRVVGEWLANGRKLPQSRGGKNSLTIAELIDRFRQHAESYYRLPNGEPTSELACLATAARPLRKLYGGTPAVEFGPLALETLRGHFIAEGYVRSSINARVDRVRRIFRWGVSRELIPASVYESLRSLPGLRRGRSDAKESEPVKPVDDAVIEATLPHMSDVVRDMVKLQRLTGARPGEVCSLRPGDVDRSSEVWVYTPAHHKCSHHGKRRQILIGPQSQSILAPYLLRDPTAHCFTPADAERQRREKEHAVRKTPAKYGNAPGTNRKARPRRSPGSRYTTAAYGKAITRACEKAGGMPKGLTREQRHEWRARHAWAANQLRHTCATELRKKFGVEAARLILGHSDARMTEVYVERDVASAAGFMQAVG